MGAIFTASLTPEEYLLIIENVGLRAISCGRMKLNKLSIQLLDVGR